MTVQVTVCHSSGGTSSDAILFLLLWAVWAAWRWAAGVRLRVAKRAAQRDASFLPRLSNATFVAASVPDKVRLHVLHRGSSACGLFEAVKHHVRQCFARQFLHALSCVSRRLLWGQAALKGYSYMCRETLRAQQWS